MADLPDTLLADGDERFPVDGAFGEAIGKHVFRVEPVETGRGLIRGIPSWPEREAASACRLGS